MMISVRSFSASFPVDLFVKTLAMPERDGQTENDGTSVLHHRSMFDSCE
jgi:hypothetical protein